MYQLSFFDTHPLPSLKALRERPGDRLLAREASASLLDLLSALLGNPDTALRLLARFPTLAELVHAVPADLQQIQGIGRRGMLRLRAALELGRRSLAESPSERPQVKSPADAANLLMGEMSLLEQEQMRVVLLDTRNRVLGVHTVYQGSLNTTVVRVCELFREATRANAAAIIVAHSHPSGDPSPSPEDVAVTQQIVSAGKLLDIEALDHIVIGDRRWVSLRERGLGF